MQQPFSQANAIFFDRFASRFGENIAMKKILLASLGCLALASGAAVAADMPLKAPYLKAPPAAISWTGCYIGANVGFDWARTSSSDAVSGADLGRENDHSLAGGGQIGCDYQFAPSFVFGIRGNYDRTQLNDGTEIVPGFAGIVNADMNIHWTATATARVGYLISPATLLYVQGGGAWTRNNLQVDIIPTFPFGGGSDTVTGWTVGVGGEYMFAPNWSAFVEGNYMDFGTHNISTTIFGTGLPGATWSTREQVYQFLVGVNLRFGGLGGPVVAKY
jgi:outer membrane immunogenic protein